MKGRKRVRHRDRVNDRERRLKTRSDRPISVRPLRPRDLPSDHPVTGKGRGPTDTLESVPEGERRGPTHWSLVGEGRGGVRLIH